MLKDYRPVPIHRIPATEVDKAKFPVIDMHAHVNVERAGRSGGK